MSVSLEFLSTSTCRAANGGNSQLTHPKTATHIASAKAPRRF
jgi:hypothetical protein